MEKGLVTVGIMMLLGASLYLQQTSTQVSDEIDMVKLYGEWKLKYNRKYTNQRDEMYRFQIFESNVRLVQAFYESPEDHGYQLAINQFADLSQEEFAQTYLNLRVPEHKLNRKVSNTYNPNGQAIDWEKAGKTPAIKNQGQCGSCWAFSAVGTLEINSRIYFNDNVDLSEQDLVDCSGVYGNEGCNGGWMDSAYEYVADNGLATGKDYPYTAKDQSCKDVAREFQRVVGYVDLNSCEEIQEAVQEQSIAVAVDASNWSLYAGGTKPFSNCKTNLNHGVILVGVSEDGVWKIRNSWGTSWGNSGHMYIAAGNTCGICIAASYPILV